MEVTTDGVNVDIVDDPCVSFVMEWCDEVTCVDLERTRGRSTRDDIG